MYAKVTKLMKSQKIRLVIFCNNHPYKCFRFIDIVTLAYIIRGCINTETCRSGFRNIYF
jgi:hypothetical protein